MLNNALTLNHKICGKEFGNGIILLFAGCFLSTVLYTTSPILLLICFFGGVAGCVIFFSAGFKKLYCTSIFGESGYLYMSVPLSNLTVVLSKVLVGGWWFLCAVLTLLGNLIAIGFHGLSDNLAGILTHQGIPAGQLGAVYVLALWNLVVSCLLNSATILTIVITVNTIGVSKYKGLVSLLVTAAFFAALYGFQLGVVLLLNKLFSLEHLVVSQCIGLLFTLVLTAGQICWCKRRLDCRYNLS